jgi:hypothetical protein
LLSCGAIFTLHRLSARLDICLIIEAEGVYVFERQLQLGHTLNRAFVEKEESKDDGWIVLENEGPDPAFSAYHVPF